MPDTPLTLPGSLPGLLRRGSPVHVQDDNSVTESAVSESYKSGHALCALAGPEILDTSRVQLDLTDVTGRFHATLFLARLCEGGESARYHEDLRWSRYMHGWELDEPCGYLQKWTVDEVTEKGQLANPWLADLDLEDLRELADGTLWVDAEALRRTVLAVWEQVKDNAELVAKLQEK